jgi:pyroglutamyl-peptidase
VLPVQIGTQAVTKKRLKTHLKIGLAMLPLAALLFFFDEAPQRRFFYITIPEVFWFIFIYMPLAMTFMATYGWKRHTEGLLRNPLFRRFYVADLWSRRPNLSHPRILITGFGPFPGAPENPTQKLIEALRANPSILDGLGEIRTEILAVEYDTAPARLAAIGAEFIPDIAIHFGLSARASGFTLERLARNEIAANRPDNAGGQPGDACIVEGGAGQPSTLPLEAIASALSSRGLPHSWSDDAGGYLCNYIFYLSRSPHFTGFSPEISGFIHVPPLAGPDAPENAMRIGDLVAGAQIIVRTCAEEWRKARAAA